MFEGIRNRRAATLAVVLFGGGLATGCGNTVEGVGSVHMVSCGVKGKPQSNSETISSVSAGEEIQMGKSIVTDNKGHYPATGDFSVKSLGHGFFKVLFGGTGNNTAYTVPNYSEQANTVTVTDKNELYVISGTPGSEGTTGLSIDVKCT